jgi:predicted GNAT family acetyltransferase
VRSPTTDRDKASPWTSSALARRALDDARGDGVRVDPQCGFVASYIERHPEYADLTATA